MRVSASVLTLVWLCGCGSSGGAERATVLNAEGEIALDVTIEIADTEDALREGLRRHGPLAKDEALLLVFPTETNACITNTGVPFPIDVLYLSATRQVIAIEHNIPPNSPGPYCHSPTAMALELNGDTLQGDNYAKLELF